MVVKQFKFVLWEENTTQVMQIFENSLEKLCMNKAQMTKSVDFLKQRKIKGECMGENYSIYGKFP